MGVYNVAMVPILSLIIAIAFAFGFAATASAGQQTRNVLDATQIVPAPPGPATTTVSFEVEWPVTCPCTLQVVNGSTSSWWLSPTRVLVGWVRVDGTLVLTPSQLSLLSQTATTALNLAPGPHLLSVQVLGGPSSFVTVSVSGAISTTDLSTARANHSATLLDDGTVLVAGGDGAAGVLNATEQVAGDASGVAPAAPLAAARAGHSAALVPGGRVVISVDAMRPAPPPMPKC